MPLSELAGRLELEPEFLVLVELGLGLPPPLPLPELELREELPTELWLLPELKL